MAKSEFAFATVKTVKPLTIVIDGDTSTLPAVAYGVTVKEKQRVEVRVRKPPQAPLITRVLTSAKTASSFVTMDMANQYVLITGSAALSDADDPTAISGWSIAGASDGFTVSDSGVAVDSDLYPDGTVFAVNVISTGATSSGDNPSLILAVGTIGGFYMTITLHSFKKPDGSQTVYDDMSTCLATVLDGAIPIALAGYAAQISGDVVTVTGSVSVFVAMFPLFIASATA